MEGRKLLQFSNFLKQYVHKETFIVKKIVHHIVEVVKASSLKINGGYLVSFNKCTTVSWSEKWS